jgi:hypothetical protein
MRLHLHPQYRSHGERLSRVYTLSPQTRNREVHRLYVPLLDVALNHLNLFRLIYLMNFVLRGWRITRIWSAPSFSTPNVTQTRHPIADPLWAGSAVKRFPYTRQRLTNQLLCVQASSKESAIIMARRKRNDH